MGVFANRRDIYLLNQTKILKPTGKLIADFFEFEGAVA